MGYQINLAAEHVRDTVGRLTLRIHDRFPDSGLGKVCRHIRDIAEDVQSTVHTIHRPIWWLRMVMAAVIVAIVGLLLYALSNFEFGPGMDLAGIIQTSEAAANDLIFLSIAVYFCWSLDNRIRRRRVLERINHLRELAHIIDMHQLTKDPDGIAVVTHNTAHSPSRSLSQHELSRYLDYCTEMLALLSKMGALYTARFDDGQVLEAASDLESLCTGLSQKIWQKLIILRGGY